MLLLKINVKIIIKNNARQKAVSVTYYTIVTIVPRLFQDRCLHVCRWVSIKNSKTVTSKAHNLQNYTSKDRYIQNQGYQEVHYLKDHILQSS